MGREHMTQAMQIAGTVEHRQQLIGPGIQLAGSGAQLMFSQFSPEKNGAPVHSADYRSVRPPLWVTEYCPGNTRAARDSVAPAPWSGGPDGLKRYDSGVTNSAEMNVLKAALARHFGAIERVDQTGSTNEDLLGQPFGRQPAAPALRWAAHQRRGRGRRARQWHDEPGRSLTFSVALERSVNQKTLPPISLPLVAGVALIQGLRAAQLPMSGTPIGLKWPNDLVRDGAKLAGILVESRRQDDLERVVIGCGVNLKAPAGAVAGAGHLPAGGLIDEQVNFDDANSQALVAALSESLASATSQYFDSGFSPFRAAWMALDIYAGQSVQLLDDGQLIAAGIARGIDETGALQIEQDGRSQSFAIGEVSVRPLDGAAR